MTIPLIGFIIILLDIPFMGINFLDVKIATHVQHGNEIVLMRGTIDSLVSRGCLMTVGNRLGEVVESLHKAPPAFRF